jgi:hypothetical protein
MGWLNNDEKVPNWNSFLKPSVASSGTPMANPTPHSVRLQTADWRQGKLPDRRGFRRRRRRNRANAIAHRPSCGLLRSLVP